VTRSGTFQPRASWWF